MKKFKEKISKSGTDHPKFFATLFDAIPVPIFYKDVNGIYRDCNDAYASLIFGLPRDQIIGRSLADLAGVAPPELAELVEMSQQQDQKLLREPGVEIYEFQLGCADGIRRDFRLYKAGVNDSAGQPVGLIGVMANITTLKRTEHALLESQRTLSTLLGNLPGMAFRCRNNPTWTMEFVSDGCLALTGYRSADLILDKKLAYAQIIHPDDRQMVWDNIQSAWQQGQVYQIIYRIITAAGLEKWVWEQGRGNTAPGELGEGVIEGFITDISEKHLAEEALRQQKEILQTIFDHVPIMFALFDADFRFKLVNREWERIIGWQLAEVQGVPIFTKIYPDAAERQEVLNFIRAAPGRWRDTRETVRDGRVVDLSWFNVRLSDGSYIGIGQDISERKRIEEALRLSEERFALAAQGANDGLWDWDIANNKLYWSPRLKELLGYADDELAVEITTLEALLHPDDLPRMWAATTAHIRQRQPYSIELRLRAKSGDYRWFSSGGQAVWDETGHPVRMVGFTSDITERKRAEAELEQRAAQLMLINQIGSQIVAAQAVDDVLRRTAGLLQSTFDYHHVALFLVDGEALRLKAVAGSYEPYFPPGHTQPLTDGINGWVATHGEKVVANDVTAETRYTSLIAEHTITQSELCLPIKVAGQTIGVLDIQSPHPNAFGQNDVIALEALTHQLAAAIENARLHEAVQQELAERKRTEAALRAEKMLVDALMDSIPDSIYFKDRHSRLTRINRKLMQDLGLTDMSEVIGKTDVDLFGPEFGQQTLADEQSVLHTGASIVGLLESRDLPDGRINWTLTNKVPLRDADGQIIGLAGVTREVNDLKQAEESLKKYSEQLEEMVDERTTALEAAQEQLLRREKLAVLGQMAGSVAHELRGPLGNIKNLSYLLKLTLPEPQPTTQEALELLDLEITASTRIINSLLDFARTKTPVRQTVDVNDLVRELLARISSAGPAGTVEIVTELAAGLPAVQADPDQLGQVFANLIHNAIQAISSPTAGQLRISTNLVEPDWVTVSFADNGAGITPENLARIFEPLFSTKTKGIGLGLALVKNIVEAHGGAIEVSSQVGQGSTFKVSLPVAQ